MKQIQPLAIWEQGSSKEAIILNAYAINVSLGNSATFYYSLLSSEKSILAQGNIVMDGNDYQAWDSDDIAWSFIAGKLNLTIIGDWVDPVIEESVAEEQPTSEENPDQINL